MHAVTGPGSQDELHFIPVAEVPPIQKRVPVTEQIEDVYRSFLVHFSSYDYQCRQIDAVLPRLIQIINEYVSADADDRQDFDFSAAHAAAEPLFAVIVSSLDVMEQRSGEIFALARQAELLDEKLLQLLQKAPDRAVQPGIASGTPTRPGVLDIIDILRRVSQATDHFAGLLRHALAEEGALSYTTTPDAVQSLRRALDASPLGTLRVQLRRLCAQAGVSTEKPVI